MNWGDVFFFLGCAALLVMAGGLTPLALLRFRRLPPAPPKESGNLNVVIPAHNEESLLPSTIASIQAAAVPDLAMAISVGADSCTDATASVATALGCEVVTVDFQNKWKTLASLVEKTPASADWIALVDAGALWPASLLQELAPHFSNPNVVAIAPSYGDPRSGPFHRIHWWIERQLKLAENVAGGPVSTHGATVFYRNRFLKSAFAELSRRNGGEPWWNDDVALPLAVRMMNPRMQIHYHAPTSSAGLVTDAGTSKSPMDFGRRLRMVEGNLQWITLLPELRRNCPAAATVALRRFARLFWAWWFFSLSLGAGIKFHPSAFLLLLPLLAMPGATAASLAAPFLFFTNRKVHWR